MLNISLEIFLKKDPLTGKKYSKYSRETIVTLEILNAVNVKKKS